MADTYVLINDPGPIANDNGPTQNPWECHLYSHAVQHQIIEGGSCTLSIDSWSLSGDVPKDITINNSGIISGTIEPLRIGQTTVTADDITPIETLDITGSNYTSIGRFKYPYRDFHFTIRVDWTVTNSSSTSTCTTLQGDSEVTVNPNSSEKGWTTYDTFIRIIKNHDIDNLLFAYYYLKAGHQLTIKNQKYEFTEKYVEVDADMYMAITGITNPTPPYIVHIKSFSDYINDHPGPFSNCGNFIDV